MAFLSIFPNTPGFSVVVTKEHRPSYVFELDDESFLGLMRASRATALRLDNAFEDVGRTGCMIEGFGIDHAHVKLFPMHGTTGPWRQIKSNNPRFFLSYEGFISSHDCHRADDRELAELARRIQISVKLKGL